MVKFSEYLNRHVFVMDDLVEKEGVGYFVFDLACGLCNICHGLFALPLGVIFRLCFVIVAIPKHLLY